LASKSSPDVFRVSSSPTLSVHGFEAETEKLAHNFGGSANPKQGDGFVENHQMLTIPAHVQSPSPLAPPRSGPRSRHRHW